MIKGSPLLLLLLVISPNACTYLEEKKKDSQLTESLWEAQSMYSIMGLDFSDPSSLLPKCGQG